MWFWKNAMGYVSQTVTAGAFKPLPLCSAPLKTFLIGIFGCSMECKKPLSKQKCVLIICCIVFQKQWMLELSIHFAIVFSTPENLLVGSYWSSRNTWKPLSKRKHVFRKCNRVSQKQWMLELSNLCHCVQYPGKLTSRDFWSSRNERKPLV